ncbi:cytochrome P450 4C1, partial [Trichonephila clavata]
MSQQNGSRGDILQRITGCNFLHVKEGFHCVWFGPNPAITMFSPEVIELVLSSSTSLEKSFEYSFLHRWLGHGLLT